jgi:methylated-DNA-protein-cysteine methyltransferase-like protein
MAKTMKMREPMDFTRRIVKASFRKNGERDEAFRQIIRSIPKGKVSTYGKIAAASGYPFYHRAVASLLSKEAVLLPWQRVVGAGGEIKVRGDGACEQRLRLKMEGVKFRGKLVDMNQFEHTLRSWEAFD